MYASSDSGSGFDGCSLHVSIYTCKHLINLSLGKGYGQQRGDKGKAKERRRSHGVYQGCELIPPCECQLGLSLKKKIAHLRESNLMN
jgi:hypothetical protein